MNLMNTSRTRFARFPWIALCVVAASCAATLAGLGPRCEFRLHQNFTDLHTIFSCHLCHWSTSHVCWSLGTFLILGGVAEARDRRAFATCAFLAALAIPPTLAAFQPALGSYRGMSGIDSALFMLIAIDVVFGSWRTRRRLALVAASLMGAFCLKILFEQFRHAAVFADSAGGGFVPVPLAHITGAALGAVVALVRRFNSRVPTIYAADSCPSERSSSSSSCSSRGRWGMAASAE